MCPPQYTNAVGCTYDNNNNNNIHFILFNSFRCRCPTQKTFFKLKWFSRVRKKHAPLRGHTKWILFENERIWTTKKIHTNTNKREKCIYLLWQTQHRKKTKEKYWVLCHSVTYVCGGLCMCRSAPPLATHKMLKFSYINCYCYRAARYSLDHNWIILPFSFIDVYFRRCCFLAPVGPCAGRFVGHFFIRSFQIIIMK